MRSSSVLRQPPSSSTGRCWQTSSHRSLGFAIPWWSLILVFFVTEAFPVHVHFRTEAHSLSLGELALIVGLYLAAPDELIFAQLLGAAVALAVVRQQRVLTASYNLAVFTLGTSLALLCFHGFLVFGDAYGPAGWAGAVVGAVAYAGVAFLLVTLRARMVSGRPLTAQPRMLAAAAAGGCFASASLAVCAMQLAQHDLRSLWVMVVPVAATAIALTTYTSLRRRQGHLEFLSQSMRAMQGAEFRSSVRELLEAARTMLSAEVAEIIVVAHPAGQSALRSAVSPLEQVLMEPITLSDLRRRALEIAAGDEAAALLPEVRPAHALDEYLAEEGLKDGIVTALRGGDRIFGMVLVGNRMGDAATFTHDDRRLFETFANHAAALLENDRVKSQLRHQAFHDSLTGFANRVLFTERVHKALAMTAAGNRRPAVLFLDLDDFKKVNDSLGHSAGDQLLLAVAERVRSCLRPEDLVARLGGDEFAVLLERANRDEAESVATRLVDVLRAPFMLEGTEMKVHASIGIALAHSRIVADEILRNADVAMYSAKTNGKGGYAWYDPEMHVRTQRRNELAATLEGSVERDEIEAYYQPIVQLETGRVVGHGGACALAPPRPRPSPSRQLHPARRGERAHAPDRPRRPRSGMRAAPHVALAPPLPRRAHREREPLAERAAQPEPHAETSRQSWRRPRFRPTASSSRSRSRAPCRTRPPRSRCSPSSVGSACGSRSTTSERVTRP